MNIFETVWLWRQFPKLLLMILISLLSTQAFADLVVVVNKGITVDTITTSQLKKLWLDKKKSISSSGRLKVVDNAEGELNRIEFYRKVVGMTEKQLRIYWRKRVFSGKSFPPLTLNNDAEIKHWVATTPNGIGYIDRSLADNSVKIVYKLP